VAAALVFTADEAVFEAAPVSTVVAADAAPVSTAVTFAADAAPVSTAVAAAASVFAADEAVFTTPIVFTSDEAVFQAPTVSTADEAAEATAAAAAASLYISHSFDCASAIASIPVLSPPLEGVSSTVNRSLAYGPLLARLRRPAFMTFTKGTIFL